jgi:CheY-like chemotaxis protein
MPATIAIERRLASCTILADPTQIHQVVINLCTNSLHAMRDCTGKLTVLVERVEVDATLAASLPKIAPGPHACLTVRDTGCGMAPAVLARIFDPFFTTKPVGEGTGLGLSVVQGIVDTNHGGITVESVVGQGTTFRIYFPICDETEAGRAKPAVAVKGAGQEIMVVDDETSIATFAGVRLQQLNYRPAIFGDPRRAIAAVQAAPGRFAAVVTDLTMPGMTGVDLVREIRRLAGPVPVVIITGHRQELGAYADLAPLKIVDKPFTGDDLGRVLQEMLPPQSGRT